MIRFSAALVAVAIGVLVGGMATSSLLLVYVAIGLSVVALLTLALGVALKREEIFGEQGQSALAGQGVNAGLGQERPGSAVSAERPAAPGRQDAFGEPFGQQAAFGQAAWAAAPDTHSAPEPASTSTPRTGAGAPWSRPAAPATPAAPAPATPGPETPPWQKRFAPPAPQPAAQTRLDMVLTRAELAKTRTDLTVTKADLSETKADPAETKADPAETRVDTAVSRLAALNWFERIASGEPPASSAGDEPVADAADSPADDAHAEAEDATVEADTTEDEEEAEAADTNAAAAVTVIGDTVVGDTVVGDTVVGDTVVGDTVVAHPVTEDTDDAEDTVVEPSAVGPDAEPEAEDSASADAADSSPDGDQEDRSGQREVTVVPGVPRYHDANCILIRFMGDDDLQKMTLDEATEAGCTPCRACMPEHA